MMKHLPNLPKLLGKRNSKQYSNGKNTNGSQEYMNEDIALSRQPSLKKRDSKKQSKIDVELHAKLLESYNDLKSISESKELPSRQVYLRRIGLGLVKSMPELFKFPIL